MSQNDLEGDIIDSVLAGRRDQYARLVRLYQEKVLSLCLSLLGNPAEAEDAAQEIFVKAFKNLSSFRRKSSFSTWIYRIAYHHGLDLLRSRAKKRTESLDALLEAGLETPARESASPLSPDRETVEALLAGLSPDYRLILTLREVQGLTYEEIARATETSLDSVKARLRRARQALQERARHLLTPADV